MRTSTRSSLSGESDYPMPDNSRIPVRERSRFDGLTADDVQLRPHLADEDEEQREERQAHRRPKPYEDEEEDKPHPPSDARSVAFMTAGVFMMFGAGLWFRLGLAFYQPPLLFIAGLALLLAGVLRFIRVRANQSE